MIERDSITHELRSRKPDRNDKHIKPVASGARALRCDEKGAARFVLWDVFLTVKDSACVGACRRNKHSSDKSHESP